MQHVRERFSVHQPMLDRDVQQLLGRVSMVALAADAGGVAQRVEFAVDLLAGKLSALGLNVGRLGHPARVEESIQHLGQSLG